MAGKVFCIGNGTSRQDFDLESLRGKGKIYGCNALYRDFKPDVLISVDNGIMHEIYQSGFSKEVECWFRNWTKVPAGHYKMMLHAGLSMAEVENVKKEWDGLYENDRGNATEFVMHGSNLSGIVNIIRQDKTRNKEKINKSFSYISWIYDGDKSNSLQDICPENRDLGWAAGAMSGYIACKNETPDEVYLIGHDLVSNTPQVNNLYAGTKHYVPVEQGATPHINWINQWSQLFSWNRQIKFYKVNPGNGKISEPISEWSKYPNLSYIDYPRLAILAGL
tara:strand:- start:28 stop:861 length:834 start_codon:yes stop_codon:yes gene_type:complete